MKFKKEVQELFRKAGWYEGRSVKERFDSVPRFNEYPDFLKEFLYEYGDLKIETKTDFVKAELDLTIVPNQRYDLDDFLDNPRETFGENIYTFPIAYYPMDVSLLQCDVDGNVYMIGDYPTRMSVDFKTGIEKVIMEDYFDTTEWHPDVKEWKEEKY